MDAHNGPDGHRDAGGYRENATRELLQVDDHIFRQDVYHAETPPGRAAYVKLTLRDHAPVIQFKEK